MQVRTGRAGGVSGGPATSTRVGNLLLDGSRGVSQLELRGPLRPRTDVGNRNRGRGGALRGLSPAVVEPGGVRPGVAHQVGGNGEIVPGGEQRRGEAAPEHVRRHLPEPGTSPEHLHPLPDGPGAHSACDHPPPPCSRAGRAARPPSPGPRSRRTRRRRIHPPRGRRSAPGGVVPIAPGGLEQLAGFHRGERPARSGIPPHLLESGQRALEHGPVHVSGEPGGPQRAPDRVDAGIGGGDGVAVREPGPQRGERRRRAPVPGTRSALGEVEGGAGARGPAHDPHSPPQRGPDRGGGFER